jgi:hypothetical protein
VDKCQIGVLSYDLFETCLTRLTFTAPDGTEYELRDALSSGQPKPSIFFQGGGCNPNGFDRGTVFVTADGTSAMFVSTVGDIVDSANADGNLIIFPTGDLTLRDGTSYHVENSLIKTMRDRNGNQMTFGYEPDPANGASFGRLITITDSVGRSARITYDVTDPAPYGLCDHISLDGFAGAQRLIRVSKTNLHNVLRRTQSYDVTSTQTDCQLFQNLNNNQACPSGTYDPVVDSVVWLPNGLTYTFFYDPYGELTRVVLPTGGAYEYDVTGGLNGGQADGFIPQATFIYSELLKRGPTRLVEGLKRRKPLAGRKAFRPRPR